MVQLAVGEATGDLPATGPADFRPSTEPVAYTVRRRIICLCDHPARVLTSPGSEGAPLVTTAEKPKEYEKLRTFRHSDSSESLEQFGGVAKSSGRLTGGRQQSSEHSGPNSFTKQCRDAERSLAVVWN